MKKELGILAVGLVLGSGSVKLGEAIAHSSPVYKTVRIELLRQESADGGVTYTQRQKRVEVRSDAGIHAPDVHSQLKDPKQIAAADGLWKVLVSP